MLGTLILCAAASPQLGSDPTTFANFETPQVHPIALRTDGNRLLVCNTADGRLLVFDVQGGDPLLAADIPVGLDPVSVRWRTTGEAWVVNHVSNMVVGTDAHNERRFESNLNGRFATVLGATVDPSGAAPLRRFDLNPHLDYLTPTVAPALRLGSVGDPRAVVWSADGATLWVAGMGSDNVVSFARDGTRSGAPIVLGEAPTGLALDDARGRLYVLERFGARLAVVDVAARAVVAATTFHDPTPAVIRAGRRFLYDTHLTSGTGHVSCATCHVDARMDRLAWDLGDPSSDVTPFDQNCRDAACEDWHPMKGPMLTQTLQDIVGKEPHHWRGDRTGLEAFHAAFESLLGDDTSPTAAEMQAFEALLATVRIPPNPFRRFDNGLRTDLVLEGHSRTGRFGNAGSPLPPGDAQRGLALMRPPSFLDGGRVCALPHAADGHGLRHRITGGYLHAASAGTERQATPPDHLGRRLLAG